MSATVRPGDRPWREEREPAQILAIRLQAVGDIVITLPYLRALHASLPDCRIDFMTRRADVALVRSVRLFRHVEGLGGGRDELRQLLSVPRLAPRLFLRRYDVVLDLQNNRVSRALRRSAWPKAWSSFDRFSPVSAGLRVAGTIARAGLTLPTVRAELPLVEPHRGPDRLREHGWDGRRPIVILSPASTVVTRQWPTENFARFAEIWQTRHDAQFVVLGLDKIRARSEAICSALGTNAIDLVGRTTAPEALGLVQAASLVLTEDCGLMHMAWTSGVATLALFGASRHDWSAPLGAHSVCLHSGDLECGACMAATCRHGDVRCLTRYSPEFVVDQAERLLTYTSQVADRQLPGSVAR